ncbi:hypothetical protein JCM11251_007854 [Rhodosporidiobolus azoricus]
MDLLPADNSGYGTKEYWDERYSKEADDSSFDWFKTYAEIKDLINRYIPDRNASIVMLGCGNSTLSRDMYDDGYHNIRNIDYSPIVIEKMAKVNAERAGMTWTVADIRDLPFPSSSIDICLDKGTLDALMTAKGLDPWNPPPEMVANVKGEIDEVVRVLKPSGRFLYLTFGQPHFRRQHIQRPGWKLDILEVGEGFSYYFYVLEREDRPADETAAVEGQKEGE